MKHRFFLSLLATGFICFITSHANAEEYQPRKDYLNFYSGSFDVLDDDNEAQFGMEYRAAPIAWDIVSPMAGINVSTDGAVYGYGGINFDWKVADGLAIIPNFAVGLYHQGSGKDLGGAIEFRSGIELDYIFDDLSRVGVAFNHVSNASIYDRNPGAETLLFNYSVPLYKFIH